MPTHPVEAVVREFRESKDNPSSRPVMRGYMAMIEPVVEELVSAGINRATIHVGRPLPVPGAYQNTARPWDILVVEEDMPVAAIDIKTLFGSIRNNMRNRMNDIVAAGANVARAFDQKAVRALKPAVGQFFLLEERRETTDPIRPPRTALSTFAPAGPPESVQGQFRDFFQRLLNDEMYDAVCFLTSTAPPNVNVREPDPAMGFAKFAAKIAERVEDIREARRRTKIQASELGRELAKRNDLSVVVAGLSTTDAGRLAVDHDVIHRRRRTLAELRDLVLNPDTTENEIQTMIGRKYWLFGGQYTGVLERRDSFALDEHDIPLVCADRSIHIVELKRPGTSWSRRGGTT